MITKHIYNPPICSILKTFYKYSFIDKIFYFIMSIRSTTFKIRPFKKLKTDFFILILECKTRNVYKNISSLVNSKNLKYQTKFNFD